MRIYLFRLISHCGFVPQGSVDKIFELVLVQVKAWRWRSNKLLPEPVMTLLPPHPSQRFQPNPNLYIMNLLHKSHNAVPYPTVHHFVTEMCTCVHFSATKWYIVGYLSDALWDLWDRSLAVTFCYNYTCISYNIYEPQSFKSLFFVWSNSAKLIVILLSYTKNPTDELRLAGLFRYEYCVTLTCLYHTLLRVFQT